MLAELRVRNLGVIEESSVVFTPGMTAVTGETGAGKTMIVTAIELLVGGRADPKIVRAGTDEAVVEGRFVTDDGECVLRRVIPAKGRSRAYIDGSLATMAELSERGAVLVDLHGQHDHQSLLQPAVQRAALDRFAGIDLAPLRAARRAVADIEAALDELGGDPRERAREIDLLRFQVTEIVAAGLDDPDEDDHLRRESEFLADATGHRDAAFSALAALTDDGGAVDALAGALSALDGRSPFEVESARLRDVLAELDDIGRDLRTRGEGIEADPERLAAIGERRRVLADLRRKYGDTLADVMTWRDTASQRLAQLESHDERAADLDAGLVQARAAVSAAEDEVGRARAEAAPRLAAAVAAHLPDLALPAARVEVSVSGTAGRDVVLQFAASPGVPLAPLARSASGGELARAMLALRLVLTEGPPVLVFDEVDAGIGGAAAIAVGGALADIASDHQVLVVTHLAQVAAWADAQVVVDKSTTATTTTTTVAVVDGDDRTTELARMLSGTPDSDAARRHASELLKEAHDARPGAPSARVGRVRG